MEIRVGGADIGDSVLSRRVRCEDHETAGPTCEDNTPYIRLIALKKNERCMV
jgi:hypothetical protein